MNRWQIITDKGSILYYSDTVEEIYKLFPEAISVIPYENKEYRQKENAK